MKSEIESDSNDIMLRQEKSHGEKMRDTSISIARISVSGAALCLALLVFSSSGKNLVHLGDLIRILVGFAGLTLTISAALSLDWSFDSLSDEQWRELLKTDTSLANGETVNLEKADQFFARIRVFGGGYALLAFGLACIATSITWLIHPSLESGSESILMGALSFGSGAFVFIKMLTKKLMSAFWPLIFVAGFLVLVFVGPRLSIWLGM